MKPLRLFPNVWELRGSEGKKQVVVLLCQAQNGTICQGQVTAAISPSPALHGQLTAILSWPSHYRKTHHGQCTLLNPSTWSIGPECSCAGNYESSSLCPCDSSIPQAILAPNRCSGAIQVSWLLPLELYIA